MMTKMCRYKLRDIIFHELLDAIRQLRKALVTEIVIPSDDLDPFSRLSVLHDPGSNLLIFGAGRYILFKLFRRDTDKTEKHVIQRAVKMIVAERVVEERPTLIQCSGSDD